MAGTVRFHRHTVFVIERVGFVDGLVYLACAPADAVIGMDVGRRLVRAVGPAVEYVGMSGVPFLFLTIIVVAVCRPVITLHTFSRMSRGPPCFPGGCS